MSVGAFDGAQRFSGSTLFSARSAGTAFSHKSWQGSSNTSRASGGSFGTLPSVYDEDTVPTTPASPRRSPVFLGFAKEPLIDEKTKPSSAIHSHWCFICPNPRVINTCDGWKRHMKEHETRYRCMPRGPIEYTPNGANCAFCGFRDPSQSHCDTHKAYPCANKSLEVRSYTRKLQLITHLKTRHISNVAELADHWKDTIDKKHFSCGFCVSHFHSLIDQLNHIDIAHYRLFQDVRDWDSNSVIRGLLLQPGVAESWRRILASHSGLAESDLRWDSSMIKRLQLKLELGHEPVEILAEAAFNGSTYDSSHQGEAGMVDNMGLSHQGGIAIHQPCPVTQATAPIQMSSSRSSTIDGEMLAPSIPHMGQSAWPWDVSNNSISFQRQHLPRDDSDVVEDNANMAVQYPYLDTNQNIMTGGGNYGTYPEPTLSTSWASAPGSNLTHPNNGMMCGYWPTTPILNPTNSSSLVPSQPKYQGLHSMGKVRPRYSNQDFLPNSAHKTAPLMQNPGLLVKSSFIGQPRKQPSRSKLKDHYDINTEADVDLDFDVLQRLMREEDGTRSEWRGR